MLLLFFFFYQRFVLELIDQLMRYELIIKCCTRFFFDIMLMLNSIIKLLSNTGPCCLVESIIRHTCLDPDLGPRPARLIRPTLHHVDHRPA